MQRPRAQDLTALWKLNELMNKHNDPVKVAMVWFTNSATPKNHWRDAYGTSPKDYKRKFLSHY